MTNPYAPPEGKVADLLAPAERRRGAMVWIAIAVYLLHTILVVGGISLFVVVDQLSGIPTRPRFLYTTPVLLMPLSTLAAAVFLLRRQRRAVVAALAFPATIGLQTAHMHATLPLQYFVPACVLAAYVVLLWSMKKIR